MALPSSVVCREIATLASACLTALAAGRSRLTAGPCTAVPPS
jgi:hypothetical protein